MSDGSALTLLYLIKKKECLHYLFVLINKKVMSFFIVFMKK